jgi:(p)ppGpp synthase/HD superfamily hydrolase
MPSPWSQEKYIAALRYAAEAHNGQKLPGTDLPYLVHVTMVAMEIIAALARENGLNGDLAVQCALLHDVIEDAGKSYEDIAARFGLAVAEGVLALSKNSLLKSEHEKMADSLERIQRQPREIRMVKLADRITNLEEPPHYWTVEKKKKYLAEAKEILDALGGAHAGLKARLEAKMVAYEAWCR